MDFGDGTTAKCIALEPPEKILTDMPWIGNDVMYRQKEDYTQEYMAEWHLAPEIFVSDGSPGSIVGDWVAARGGIGGIHHLAYQVESVENIMAQWKQMGYAEFTSETPLTCPGLTQVFTKPSELTGVIYEFINRGEHGFCKENVKGLMESTKGL